MSVEAEEVERGVLERQLRGRAAFLAKKGSVKSARLMNEAADLIASLQHAKTELANESVKLYAEIARLKEKLSHIPS